MQIRSYAPADRAAAIGLWNASVEAGEVVYRHIDAQYFQEKFSHENGCAPQTSLVAEENGQVVGFISGSVKRSFFSGETPENTPGFLSVIFVDAAHRRQGIGTALLDALLDAMRALGKSKLLCAETNPVQLDWIVPNTPGHDHNKAPGVDLDCPGFSFLLARGFEDRHHEVAMYLDLSRYELSPKVTEIREKLEAEGVHTGRYDISLGYDFDRMCDRVGSEYWRQVLREETTSERPRVILAATHDRHIVGFTGPVDIQESGRGWFTGICTDPEYEKRGIASVLFNFLMQEFIAIGATFSTLFTGDDNHAQRLYLRTGFDVVRKFAIMGREL